MKAYEMRELTSREMAMVSGADFSWGGLQAGMATGFVVGAIAGFGFGFAGTGTPALMGGIGGLMGGAGYLLGELID